jgi:hypothetical protein
MQMFQSKCKMSAKSADGMRWKVNQEMYEKRETKKCLEILHFNVLSMILHVFE